MDSIREKAAEEFVEIMGLVLQSDGLSRTAGRILAMLILMDRPAGLDEIANYLQVSRSGVSTNTRELERIAAIERSTRPGDRQYYFEVVNDVLSPLLNNHVERMNKALATIRKASATIPPAWEQACNRLDRMDFFYSIAIGKTNDLIHELADADKANAPAKRPAITPAD